MWEKTMAVKKQYDKSIKRKQHMVHKICKRSRSIDPTHTQRLKRTYREALHAFCWAPNSCRTADPRARSSRARWLAPAPAELYKERIAYMHSTRGPEGVVLSRVLYKPTFASHRTYGSTPTFVRTAVLPDSPHLCVLLLPLVLISNSLRDVVVAHAIISREGLLSGW